MVQRGEGPSREQWIEAALGALVEGGVEAVKVERLAATLGVSKGPFYWKFGSRTELLESIVEVWKNDFTAGLIAASAAGSTPRERLERLAELALEPHARSIDVAKAEGALRAWAAQDDLPRRAVQAVDDARLAHLEGEFRLLGASAGKARDLARMVYMALLGLYTLRQYTPALADDRAFRALVAVAIDAAGRGGDLAQV